jgi:putative CocE/NonD family hydrolase
MTPYREEFARIEIPVLQTTGYYDGGQVGTLHYFNEHRKHNPRANHTLLIGPYGHLGAQHQAQNFIEGYAIDPVARMDMHTLRYAWFDHVLKGAPRPEILKDIVNYQVMGANTWRHAPSLEAMSSGTMKLHLVGATLADKPPSGESSIEMTIDLADRSDADWVHPTWIVSNTLDKHNALTFVSEPMTKDVEVSGRISGTLDFVSNKADMDFTVSLYELTPSGEYMRLSIPYYQRASYLRDPSRRQLLEPGQRQQLSFVKPGPVSRLVKAGSCLVLLLGINKNREAQVNYGTGKDVSDESIADASAPLRIQWFSTSLVNFPIAR